MERWGIDISKEYFKFSAAHFLIFPDGSAERLHGHNYRVYVDLDAPVSEFGLVIDFIQIKPLVREIVQALDERWLVPGKHPELKVTPRAGGAGVDVRYRERYYAAPTEDVLILPLNNTSSENLAAYIGRELMQRIRARFPEVELQRLRVAVEETSGQRGHWRFEASAS